MRKKKKTTKGEENNQERDSLVISGRERFQTTYHQSVRENAQKISDSLS
jgi:hypothetical protein